MPRPDSPLTLERILSAAEETLKRFGPAKATVVDVARALGVSHAAVYRHVPNKALLRDLVVERWLKTTMPVLRAAASEPGTAPVRLRRFFDALVQLKRRRVGEEPELFRTYQTLAAASQSVAESHLDALSDLAAEIITAGIAEGTFRPVDAKATARAVILATSWFHHPAKASAWLAPTIDADYDGVWHLVMHGLRPAE